MLLFVHLLLSPLIFWTQTVEQFEYNKVAVLTAAAIVLVGIGLSAVVWKAVGQPATEDLAALWSTVRPVSRQPIALGVLLLALSAIASTVTSISPRTSFYGAHESFAGLGTILAYTVLFFATRALCRTAADGRRLLAASVVAAGIVSTYALVQVALLDPSQYHRLDHVGAYVPPFGTLGNSNFLAAFLVMTVPIAAYFIHVAVKQRQRFAVGVFLAIGVLSWLVIILALSRGAWIALACTAAAVAVGWFAVGERRKAVLQSGLVPLTIVIIAVGVVVSGGYPLFASVAQRVHHFTDDAGRWALWRGVFRIFVEHPIFGSGLDTLQLAFQGQRTMASFVTPTKAHNEAIHILATQGLVGAAGATVLTVGLVGAGCRAWRRARNGDRLFVVALCAGVVGFYVQNFFSFTVAACGTLFVTFAALLSRLGEVPQAPEPHAAFDSFKPFAFGLIVACVLAGLVLFANAGTFGGSASADALWGFVAVSTAFVLVSLGVLALERSCRFARLARPGRTSAASTKREEPKRGAHWSAWLLQAGIWGGVTLVLFNTVLLPVAADRACRRGLDLMAREPKRALEALQRAVAIDPGKEVYWLKLGTAAESGARSAQSSAERLRFVVLARGAFEHAVELVPNNASTHAKLGRILGALARDRLATPAQAFVQFDQALALEKQNAYHYAAAGNTALALGDLTWATRYASRGEALNPRFGPTRALLGQIAMRENHLDAAVDVLGGALGLDWYESRYERVIAQLSLAETLAKLERFEEATTVYREAVGRAAEYPEQVEGRIQLALALERLGERDEAIAEYRRVTTRDPGHQRAREALRRLDLGDLQGAVKRVR